MEATLAIAAGLALIAGGIGYGAGDRAIHRAAIAAWFALASTLGIAAASAWGALTADALALAAATLTCFVGAAALAFSQRYLRADANRRGFAQRVLLLLAATLAFAGARDVLTLAVGWIVSGSALAALIGHAQGWSEAERARRRATTLFTASDLALVAALALLALSADGWALDALARASTPVTEIAAFLLVVAASVRCALPPFQRWLSRSMTAPTPVSALMHAGFVNGGGILLIRLAPVLEAAPLARALAVATGIAAALIGTAMMLVRPDIKRALAGSTVSQMGFMLMTCGLGAYAAALWHLIAHGLFKAWLFLRSGSAIGIGGQVPAIGLSAGAVAAIGIAAVAATVALAQAGALPAAGVPVVLACAAAVATLLQLGRATGAAPAVLAMLALYAAGLLAAEHWMPHAEGPMLGGAWLPPVIVAIFMAGWLAQTLVRSGRLTLSPALYARLLNA